MFLGPAVDDDDDDEEEEEEEEGKERKSMLGPRHGAHTCIRLPVPNAGEGRVLKEITLLKRLWFRRGVAVGPVCWRCETSKAGSRLGGCG